MPVAAKGDDAGGVVVGVVDAVGVVAVEDDFEVAGAGAGGDVNVVVVVAAALAELASFSEDL